MDEINDDMLRQSTTTFTIPITVHVYRLIANDSKKKEVSNDVLEFCKLGIYHTGVEVLGNEYSFGCDPTGINDPSTDGIFAIEPKTASGEYKESIVVGELLSSNFGEEELTQVLESMRPSWRACTYHILHHNCVSFSREFCARLKPSFEEAFPKYTYKAANVGGKVIPDAMVKQLTKFLSPPTSFPKEMIGKIDISPYPDPTTGGPDTTVPPPMELPLPAESNPTPETAPKEVGGIGGFLRKAKVIAKGAVDVTKGAVHKMTDAHDRKSMAAEFRGTNAIPPNCLEQRYTCYVRHLNRRQRAHVYVTDEGLAIGGANDLAVKLDWRKIHSLHLGQMFLPPTPGLPPTFRRHTSRFNAMNGGEKLECLVYMTDGRCIPLFDWQGHVPLGMKTSTAKLTNQDPYLPFFLKAFEHIERRWHAAKGN